MQHLRLVVHLLGEYDPPDDEYFEESVEAYRASLHAKYPLCRPCQTRAARHIQALDTRLHRKHIQGALCASRAARESSPALSSLPSWGRRLLPMGWGGGGANRHAPAASSALGRRVHQSLALLLLVFHLLGSIYPETFVPEALIPRIDGLEVGTACTGRPPFGPACFRFASATARILHLGTLPFLLAHLAQAPLDGRWWLRVLVLGDGLVAALLAREEDVPFGRALFAAAKHPMAPTLMPLLRVAEAAKMALFAWHVGMLLLLSLAARTSRAREHLPPRTLPLPPVARKSPGLDGDTDDEDEDDDGGISLVMDSISLGGDAAYHAFQRARWRQGQLALVLALGMGLVLLLREHPAVAQILGPWSEAGLALALVAGLRTIILAERARRHTRPWRILSAQACCTWLVGRLLLPSLWAAAKGQSLLSARAYTRVLGGLVAAFALAHLVPPSVAAILTFPSSPQPH